jgi:hypothetical protein
MDLFNLLVNPSIGSIRLLFETLLRRIAEDQGRVAGDDAA